MQTAGQSPAVAKAHMSALPRSVPDRDAGNLGALQGPADSFRLVAVEAREACAEQLFLAPGYNRFGEGISIAEHAPSAFARGLDALPCLALGLQRADLNDPARADHGL